LNAVIEKIQYISDLEQAKKILAHQIHITDRIQKAIDFASMAHEGQFRKSGEPYVIHPILVAAIVASISEDEVMVIAALLHDVAEDTEYSLEDIEALFGHEVALLVDGLTKLSEIREEELASSDSDEKLIRSALTFKNMLLVSVKDPRVLVIKLCDRLHNMMTLHSLRPDKQKRISEETLVVYAPIAHRLGISKLKNLLEDLAFKYIYPEEYAKIDDYLNSHKQDLTLRLNNFIESAKKILVEHGFARKSIAVEGRVKHHYSIYLKMQRKGVTIEEILDLLAIRVILPEPIDCYKVLGIFHLNYTPIISRFKDYIALPKDNGYQTIHTTLFFDDAIVESQIRTHDMHMVAEYGIAAHWKYKGGTDSVKLDWISNLPFKNESAESFYEAAKNDLYVEDIVVFSPKGEHYTLPKGSVVLDYAYAVHSEIGDYATAATVNKESTSLLKSLKSGDIVNIIVQDRPRLHCSWVDSVKTNKAKEGIKSICRQRKREVDTKVAYSMLATIFNTTIEDIHKIAKEVLAENNIYKITDNLDTLKEKISKIARYKKLKEVRFWELMKRGYKKPYSKDLHHFTFYTNKNIEHVEFDYCCHPKLGDEIIAIYKDNTAHIHHKLCTKAYDLLQSGAQTVYVEWKEKQQSKYRIIVALQNRAGTLLELLKELEKFDLNITKIEFGIENSNEAEYCTLEVETTLDIQNRIKDIIANKFKLIDFISLKDAYKH
jgi:guanosine-3',5'-bis(diphosphate) 3'-pyrophosphohydrolase